MGLARSTFYDPPPVAVGSDKLLARLERAVATLRETVDVPDQLLAHLSLLGWEM